MKLCTLKLLVLPLVKDNFRVSVGLSGVFRSGVRDRHGTDIDAMHNAASSMERNNTKAQFFSEG